MITWEFFTKQETYKNNEKVYNNIFDTELNRSLTEAYFNTHQGKLLHDNEENKKQGFYKWVFSLEDINIKRAAFVTQYIFIKKSNKNIEYATTFFLKALVYMSITQQQHNCIHVRGNKIILSLKKFDKEIIFNHFYEVLNYFSEQFEDEINKISKSKITP